MRGALLSLGAAVVAVVAAQAAPVSVDEILSNPDRFDGQMVTLEGKPTVPIRCRGGGGNVCHDQARPALPQSLTSRSPFPPEIVGAKAKNAVENALHTEVCARTLTLKAAQTIIAADWFQGLPGEDFEVTSRTCESTGHAIQRTAWVNRPQSASASFANVATFYHKLVGREDKR